MNYRELVKDFAQRTKTNLETLRAFQLDRPDKEVFEVTQLVNLLLGLLVFPEQEFITKIPETPIKELVETGRPVPQVYGEFEQVENLKQLIRYLRNAVAHFNIKFTENERGQINGLIVWNYNHPREKIINWRAKLTLDDIEKLTDRFIELILKETS
jgi:hypothetical protein